MESLKILDKKPIEKPVEELKSKLKVN
jgi:hypothetical protein